MSRSREELLGSMARAARLVPFDETATWRDALFATATGGPTLSHPDEPDRALLHTLAGELAGLETHVATLPDRLRVEWLESILGIARLPVVADRVVAHVSVDPKVAPAVVPLGTRLRGGKDALGNERRYRTTDALTAHGAGLTGMRVLVPGGPPSGSPGVALAGPDFPLAPPTTADEAVDATPAEHRLRVHSPALAFSGGELAATLDFDAGATEVPTLLAEGLWRHPRADGTLSDLRHASDDDGGLRIRLDGGCVDPDGGDPWVECVWPATAPVPEGFRFSEVTVSVVERSGVVPDATFANEGLVDVTKEFEPFLATARAGDAFSIRCDEALAKKVDHLTVDVAPFASASGGLGVGVQILDLMMETAADGDATESVVIPLILIWSDPDQPNLRWQRRLDGAWSPLTTTAASTFGGLDTDVTAVEPASEVSAVGGEDGRYLRIALTSGDLGWSAYQRQVASFATMAVKNPASAPTLPSPPVAARYQPLTIGYTTAPVPATRVEAWSGWRHTVAGTGAFQPFRVGVDEEGRPAMVAVGLELTASVTGSSVSLYLDIDSSAACGSTEPLTASWQWWGGGAWHPLPVADGTRGLREAGLVRFVAPEGWDDGCPDVSAATGRWVRFVTDQPLRLGTVREVVPDAVVATYESQAPDPATDPSPETALPLGTIKGTLEPVPGVKKVTNVASVRGRGPESDPAYRERASALVRHRGRALTAWDHEQTVALAFPEVAAVRCLPHTGPDGERSPGSVGLVVVPDRPGDPSPRPDVSLVGRIGDTLGPTMPLGARVAVLCPLYAPVTVDARVRLRPGVAALEGRAGVEAALERLLHPGATPRWGLPLYTSSVVAALEREPVVDVVEELAMYRADGGPAVEVVEVDPCRGLYCSSGAHPIACEEQL